MENCPCGLKKSYLDCCGIYITGKAFPVTPEQLMRSRYTAYAIGNIDYIVGTMQGPAIKDFDFTSAKIWSEKITWLGLRVLKTNQYQDKGFVEFIAYYTDNDRKQKIHETSQFGLIKNKWYYIQGKIHNK
jgi:SEC-C motif-containing protein